MNNKLNCQNAVSDFFHRRLGWLLFAVVVISVFKIVAVIGNPLPSEKIKVLSKSPDGQVEIITIIPKGEKLESYIFMEKISSHVAKNIVYSGIYLRDKRNAPEVWFDLDPEDADGSQAMVDWVDDSMSFTLVQGDEKVWTKNFFVLRKDFRSSRMIYEQPRLPNIVRAILDNSKERPRAFDLPDPVEYEKGKFLKVASGWKLSEPQIADSGSKGGPVVFKLNYFLMNNSGVPAEGTWQYECVFTTMDWVGYDLKKITRTGKASSLAYKPEHPDDQPLILYDKNISGN